MLSPDTHSDIHVFQIFAPISPFNEVFLGTLFNIVTYPPASTHSFLILLTLILSFFLMVLTTFYYTIYQTTCSLLYLLLLLVPVEYLLLPTKYKLHKGRVCLFYYLLHNKDLELYLAYNKFSINGCWRNEWKLSASLNGMKICGCYLKFLMKHFNVILNSFFKK